MNWRAFLLLFLLYASLVHTDVSWNDGSRLASLESLVERRSLVIDNSSFFNVTSDRVFVNGRFYSDKAPGMVLLAAPIYFLAYLVGITFSSNPTAAIFMVNLVPPLFSALLVVMFHDSLRFFVGGHNRLLLSAALAAVLAVYSGVFVSHNIAAFFVFASFFFLLRYTRESRKKLYLAAAGVSGGIAVLVEYPSLLLLPFIFLYFFSRVPLRRLAFAASFIAPFILLILLYNYSITGNPVVSPYSYLHAWDGSPFDEGENSPSLSRVTLPRLASMYFAGGVPRADGIYVRGLFVTSPVLLLSLASLRSWRRKENIFLAAALVFSLFYLTLTEVTGGCNYVNRYLVPLVPLLFVPLAAAMAHRHFRIPFYALLAATFVMLVPGALVYPFSCSHFPFISAVGDVFAGRVSFGSANLLFAALLAAAACWFSRKL